MSRELFIKTLLSDFFKSPALRFDQKSEPQAFVDEYPNMVLLSDFHQRLIWYDLRYYLPNEEFLGPVTTLPESSRRGQKNTFSDVS